MKLDELMEKERQEKDSISRRAGVLNLMLHSTFNHEVMEKVIKMQKAGGGGGGGPGSGPAVGVAPQAVAPKSREENPVKKPSHVVTA